MNATIHFNNIQSEIIRQLKKSQSEIKVCMAWLTDEDLIRTLTHRAESGVRVQIVISESKENFRNTIKFKDLLRLGGMLHVASPKFLHNKFCIIDNKTIINGSYNWTYYAQKNEENILVMNLDSSDKDDNRILLAFDAKHNHICNKASVQILDISELDYYAENGIVAAFVLAQIDEEQIRLRQELENDVRKSHEEAKRIGIPFSSTIIERMQLDGRGVEFIKRLLHDEMTSGEMKSGFRKLEEPIPHRVDLSFEYLVSRPKYQVLFNAQEVEFCKKLMEKYRL